MQHSFLHSFHHSITDHIDLFEPLYRHYVSWRKHHTMNRHNFLLLYVLLIPHVTSQLDLPNTCKERFQRQCYKMLCRPPWYPQGQHCYLLVQNKMDLMAAENHCQSLSLPGRPAHIASIADKEENNFALQYIESIRKGENVWIGFNDRLVEGQYTWIDGSVNNYANWQSNQPDDNRQPTGVREDCTFLRRETGAWHDVPCTNTFISLCKM